jgi:hypothetical protein
MHVIGNMLSIIPLSARIKICKDKILWMQMLAIGFDALENITTHNGKGHR